MKKVKLLVEVESTQGIIHPVGTIGLEIEDGRMGPLRLIEVRVPDDTLAGGAWYDFLDLFQKEFEYLD